MESTFKLEHNYISFFDRAKRYILLLIGIISIFGIFSFVDGKSNNFFLLIGLISLVVGGYLLIKIYRTRYFLIDFYSDSTKIFITYLSFSEEIKLESNIDQLEAEVRNTSSRAGFNCEVILKIDNKKFYLNNDFNLGLLDLKRIVDYLKFHKDLNLTSQEKFTLERLDERLNKIPF